MWAANPQPSQAGPLGKDVSFNIQSERRAERNERGLWEKSVQLTRIPTGQPSTPGALKHTNCTVWLNRDDGEPKSRTTAGIAYNVHINNYSRMISVVVILK